jgi:two-component system, OmpR family, sensor histidine kinase QseC
MSSFRNFMLLRLAVVFAIISILLLPVNIIIAHKIFGVWLQLIFMIVVAVLALILFIYVVSFLCKRKLSSVYNQFQTSIERERRFAGDVAHELRSPLTAMRTYSQIALNASNATERNLAMEKVIASVDRSARTIQQLLTLSRMQQGASLKSKEPVDLKAEATQMLSDHFHVAKKKQIELELIAPSKPVFIAGNHIYIATLLRNLIDNAIVYSPANTKVKIIIKQATSGIVLKTIDSGPGIPKELREKVFEPFYRIESKDGVMGSGLGLSIVKQIVQIHNAAIELKTPKSGKGLEVKIVFPKI